MKGGLKMKKSIIGTKIGIYEVLRECDYKASDGHKMYHVRCCECGWETDKRKIDINRVGVCTHRNKLSKEEINKWYEKNKKQCLCCGEYIPLGSLGFNEYKGRNFCSQSCSISYNNRKRIIKNKKQNKKQKKKCLNCGKELSNNKKTYCNTKCQKEYNYKTYIDKWKNGKTNGIVGKAWIDISNYIRKYIFEKYNYKCAKCGWSEINPYTGKLPLEIEHIDGDATNNKEENLTLLCPNCHSLTSTYRGANKGQGTRNIKWLSRTGTTNVKN